MRKSLIALSALAATAMPTFAADYTDGDIHKNDYKWMQFNYMYSIDEAPRVKDADNTHDYLEMEFGGRSGIFDLYGYVDIFNLLETDSSDKDGEPKIFMKFAPRVSLDALTGTDLSFGVVQEVYFSTLFNWGGGENDAVFPDVNNSFWGIGADVQVPWFGKVGVNSYALYDVKQKDWNGYQLSLNWFKPFFFFENKSFISFQGYIDWQFSLRESMGSSSSDGGVMFTGIYWHSDRYSVGYGLKSYKNVYGIKDTDDFESTGFSHYIAATYKF
jgi:nucleoside-specific channel-forming protein